VFAEDGVVVCDAGTGMVSWPASVVVEMVTYYRRGVGGVDEEAIGTRGLDYCHAVGEVVERSCRRTGL
jgi:hypothetical protein